MSLNIFNSKEVQDLLAAATNLEGAEGTLVSSRSRTAC